MKFEISDLKSWSSGLNVLKKTALAALIMLLILLSILIVVPAMVHTTAHPGHVLVQFELNQLDDSLTYYAALHGELFPSSDEVTMFQHIRNTHPQISDPETRWIEYGRDPRDLDDSEMLVLFLSETLDEVLTGNRHVCYEFKKQRLVDSDRDGWYEYTSIEGHVFRYDGKHPSVYSKSLGGWITAEPAERPKPAGSMTSDI
jgi:hypothetical protein